MAAKMKKSMLPGDVWTNPNTEDMLLYYLRNALDDIGRVYDEEMLGLMLKYFPSDFKDKLFKDSVTYAGNLKLDVDYIVNAYHDGSCDMDETLIDLFRKWQIRKKFQNQCIRELKLADNISITQNKSYENNLMQLKTMFSLNDLETEILELFYHVETNNSVSKLVDILTDYLAIKTTRYSSNLNEKTIAVMLNLHRIDVQKVLKTSASLVKFGILDNDREITNEIMAYLEGFDETPVLQHYFIRYNGPVIPLKDHFVPPQEVDILCELYRQRKEGQGINILLYGVPGTGKTEFVRSLSHHLSAKLFQINSIDSNDDNDEKKDINHFRMRAYAACQNSINTQKGIIMMDEADSLLNSMPRFFLLKNTMDKGQINNLLDDSGTFTVWITNHIDGMDESTRRRFNYAVKFEEMGVHQRQKLWRYKIKEYKLQSVFPLQDVEEIAARYEINAGGIDKTLQNLAALYRSKSDNQISLKKLEQILDSYQVLVNGKKPPKRPKDKANYGLEGLNVDCDINQVMNTVKAFNNHWQNNPEDLIADNLNLFLYGPPGTGKTEFAGYISRKLKSRLLVKRGSDLLSPYIGVTEKLISEAFEQAEREQAILFIDEADSFLFTRENAGRSWELSQVNELLTNMENFTGIFIAATNYKETIDSAAIRRFSIKIKFDYLSTEGNLIFYHRFFSPWLKKQLSKSQQEDLRAVHCLTPGDFKVVYQKYLFVEKENLNHGIIIDALNIEVETKNENIRRIGF
jgi:SpoVK/Ycf46/Vps4 family AAA+-type ATPase